MSALAFAAEVRQLLPDHLSEKRLSAGELPQRNSPDTFSILRNPSGIPKQPANLLITLSEYRVGSLKFEDRRLKLAVDSLPRHQSPRFA